MKNNHLHSFLGRAAQTGALASCVLGLLVATAPGQTSSSTSSTRDQDRTSGSSTNTQQQQEQQQRTGTSTGATSDRSDRATTPTRTDTRSRTDSTYGRASTTTTLERVDRRFLEKAADSSHKEMEAINIASNRVSNAELKSLNDKFSTDHRKMHDELMTLAQRKGVSLTDEDYSRPNRQIRKLSDEDKDFDKEYLALMEEEHEDAVRLFEKAATDCKDTEIREFAGKHLPTLREHLTKIRDSKRNLR